MIEADITASLGERVSVRMRRSPWYVIPQRELYITLIGCVETGLVGRGYVHAWQTPVDYTPRVLTNFTPSMTKRNLRKT